MMKESTFEEYSLPISLVDPVMLKYMESGQGYRVKCQEGVPICLDALRNVICTAIKVEELGDSKSRVTTESGLFVFCPSFMKPGDRFTVDTATNSYLYRN